MPSQPFSYQPYAQPYTGSIAQLMMAPAQIQGQALEEAARAHAAATAQAGNVWAKSFEATGQDLARPLATIASPEYQGAQLQLAGQRRQWAGLQLYAQLAKQHGNDFGAIGQGLMQAGFPDMGTQVLSSAAQMQELQTKMQGEHLDLTTKQRNLASQFAQSAADAIGSGADPAAVILPKLHQLQSEGVPENVIDDQFGAARSLVSSWGPQAANVTPEMRTDLVSALKSGTTPETRQAAASATTAEANAAIATAKANFLKQLQSGDPHAPSAFDAAIHQALGSNPPLEQQTLGAVHAALLATGDPAKAVDIITNAAKQMGQVATAGPESAARATAVPGSEAQYVQNALTTAAKLKGSALTDAETKAVTDGSRTQFAIAGKDPLQRQAELSEVQLRNLMLQADQVPAATIDKIKTDLQRDPTLFAQATKGMNAIQMAQVRNSLPAGLLQNIDNSTHQMRLMAQEILPQIDTIQQEAQQLKDAGLTGLVGGHWRDLLAGKAGVAAAVANLNPQLSQLVGKFAADVGLLETAVAKAHGGARGGGSPEMLKHYETIMAPGGKDFNTFLGNLEGVKDWMSGYATLGMTTPDTKTPDLQTQTPDLIWDPASQSFKKPGGGS